MFMDRLGDKNCNYKLMFIVRLGGFDGFIRDRQKVGEGLVDKPTQ